MEVFNRATQGRWTAKELRAAGLPTPNVSVLKRRMDIRPRPMPAADAADGDARLTRIRRALGRRPRQKPEPHPHGF
jgi:hypothetical protein